MGSAGSAAAGAAAAPCVSRCVMTSSEPAARPRPSTAAGTTVRRRRWTRPGRRDLSERPLTATCEQSLSLAAPRPATRRHASLAARGTRRPHGEPQSRLSRRPLGARGVPGRPAPHPPAERVPRRRARRRGGSRRRLCASGSNSVRSGSLRPGASSRRMGEEAAAAAPAQMGQRRMN